MRIVKTDSDLKIEQIQNNRDFISSVLDEIFLICRNDVVFKSVKNKIGDVDTQVETFNKKLEKQTSLVSHAKEIEKDVRQKIAIIDEQNEKMKDALLEQLGSSL